MPKSYWYQACKCNGDIAAFLSRLDECVAENPDLRPYIQETCVQVYDKREFFLFVGIGVPCPRGLLPAKITGLLDGLGQKRVRVFRNGEEKEETIRLTRTQVCDRDDRDIKRIIKEWVDKTEGKIIYRAPEPVRVTDFDANDLIQEYVSFAEQTDAEDYLLAETTRYDQLLLLLSAKGEGSTEAFGNYCAALWSSANGAEKNRVPKPAHVLRRLSLLGHLTVHPDGKRWKMLSPLLVRSIPDQDAGGENGESIYTLVGKRDARLLDQMRRLYITISAQPQKQGDGPATQFVCLNAEQREAVSEFGIGVCDDYEACIDDSLPDLATWRASLASFKLPAMYEYQTHFFDGEKFTPCTWEAKNGLYELWTIGQSEADTGRFWRTAFYDAAQKHWLSGDWYGLRYLSHIARHASSSLMHRSCENTCEVVCADPARLPLTFERALVLASGQLPFRRKSERGALRLVYADVPYSVAALVTHKLGVPLLEVGCGV